MNGDAWPTLGTFARVWASRLVLALAYFLVATLLVQVTLRILRFIRNRTPWDFGLRLLRAESSGVIFSLANGLITYGIYIIATLLVLRRVFGVDTTALVTASGIIGLAIGFGTQGLVRDFVSGLLLVVDGVIRPGDVVEIGGQSGVVQDVNFRSTTLQDAQGEIRQIPNGSISTIINYGPQGLEAVVDLFVEDEPAAVQVSPGPRRVQQAVVELTDLSRFFELSSPVRVLPLPASGLTAIEVAGHLLPSRRALIDQLLVPTLRDALVRSGLKLHEGRITVHYRQPQPATGSPPSSCRSSTTPTRLGRLGQALRAGVTPRPPRRKE